MALIDDLMALETGEYLTMGSNTWLRISSKGWQLTHEWSEPVIGTNEFLTKKLTCFVPQN